MNDKPLEKYPAESVLFHFDCTQIMSAGETITGTPSVGFLPALTGGDALQLGPATVNTEAVTYPDSAVAQPGKVVQVRIAGGSVPANLGVRSYSVSAMFSTSAGNTMVARAIMIVRNPAPTPA